MPKPRARASAPGRARRAASLAKPSAPPVEGAGGTLETAER
jgi:hypothetical protein